MIVTPGGLLRVGLATGDNYVVNVWDLYLHDDNGEYESIVPPITR